MAESDHMRRARELREALAEPGPLSEKPIVQDLFAKRGRPSMRCEECGRYDRGEPGWKALLTDDEPPEVALFCPSCAEREFSDDSPA